MADRQVPIRQTRGPEQALIGSRSHVRGERLHLSPVRDHETEAPGTARGATHGEGAQHLRQRARVRAAGWAQGLGLECRDAVQGMEP